MNILFAGSSDFSLPILELLITRRCVSAVLTNPDSRAGRGLKLHSTPVKELALAHNIPLFQAEALRGELLDEIATHKFDVLVCASYGKIFGPRFLSLFKRGKVNVHPSLLPRFRGATPIPSAILARDKITGVCLQKIALEMDEGDIILQAEHKLDKDVYLQSLQNALSELSVGLMDKLLDDLDNLLDKAHRQDAARAVYCRKISSSMGWLQWWEPATHVYAMVRALSAPYSGVKLHYKGQCLKIWKATLVSEHENIALSGQVLGTDEDNGVLVQCARGIIGITELQVAGKKRMGWKDFVRGNRDIVTYKFEFKS